MQLDKVQDARDLLPQSCLECGSRNFAREDLKIRPIVGRPMAVKYQTQARYAARIRNLAIAVLFLGGCTGQTPPAAPLPHVSVATPIVRDVIDWDDYVGRFEAVQDVTVMPPAQIIARQVNHPLPEK